MLLVCWRMAVIFALLVVGYLVIMKQRERRNRWRSLEGTPQALNSLLRRMGFQKLFRVADILSTETVPVDAVAVIAVLPASSSPSAGVARAIDAPETYFVTQRAQNACGVLALLHAVARGVPGTKDGPIARFIQETHNMDPDARGDAAMKCTALKRAHDAVAGPAGPTGVASAGGTTDHFVCLIISPEGRLLCLDGLFPRPTVLATGIDAWSAQAAREALGRVVAGAQSGRCALFAVVARRR
jgi:hypothetical protein